MPTKVHIVKALVMYGCESWTIKKAEHQRIDAFKLWCWRRLLRVLWIAKRSNQSIVKEINHEYLLEGLMLKLKLQYFGHLMWRADSLEKTLMLGKMEGRRKRGWQRMRWPYYLDGHEFEQAPGVGDVQGSLACWVTESDTTEQLNWTELKGPILKTYQTIMNTSNSSKGMSSFHRRLCHWERAAWLETLWPTFVTFRLGPLQYKN